MAEEKQHGKWEVTQKQLRALKRRVERLEKLLAVKRYKRKEK